MQYTEYHDFTNNRRRVDADGFTKIYRYDVQDWDHQPFPAPKVGREVYVCVCVCECFANCRA